MFKRSTGFRSVTDALFWIEWLDRLERCLDAAGRDISTLARNVSANGLAGLAQTRRQLLTLHRALQDLDRSVFADLPTGQPTARVQDISQSLESIALQIERTANWLDGVVPAERTRVLTVIDGLLRECRFQARVLLSTGSRNEAGRSTKPASAFSTLVVPPGLHATQDL
jgi:hypothetical protein